MGLFLDLLDVTCSCRIVSAAGDCSTAMSSCARWCSWVVSSLLLQQDLEDRETYLEHILGFSMRWWRHLERNLFQIVDKIRAGQTLRGCWCGRLVASDSGRRFCAPWRQAFSSKVKTIGLLHSRNLTNGDTNASSYVFNQQNRIFNVLHLSSSNTFNAVGSSSSTILRPGEPPHRQDARGLRNPRWRRR